MTDNTLAEQVREQDAALQGWEAEREAIRIATETTRAPVAQNLPGRGFGRGGEAAGREETTGYELPETRTVSSPPCWPPGSGG